MAAGPCASEAKKVLAGAAGRNGSSSGACGARRARGKLHLACEATRAFVLERNGNTCMSCGCAAGDVDPLNPARTVRLTIGHVIDKDKGGSDDLGNLRAVCTNCNEGLQNLAPVKPDLRTLFVQVRRATRDDQEAIRDWLNTKFGSEPRPYL